MTFDSVKGQRSSKKKSRGTVLPQIRIEKKITQGQVRPGERPVHLRPQGSLPKTLTLTLTLTLTITLGKRKPVL